MTDKKPSELAAERRKARQEEMLKANLRRRKEQARARKKPAEKEMGEAIDEERTGLGDRRNLEE